MTSIRQCLFFEALDSTTEGAIGIQLCSITGLLDLRCMWQAETCRESSRPSCEFMPRNSINGARSKVARRRQPADMTGPKADRFRDRLQRQQVLEVWP